jgi:hypothetical protein
VDTHTAPPPPPPADTTLEKRVVASADDAEESSSGSVSLTSGDLELMIDGTPHHAVGLRFTALAIPQGATVTSAYVQFVADEAQSEATSLTIRGEAVDDARGLHDGERRPDGAAGQCDTGVGVVAEPGGVDGGCGRRRAADAGAGGRDPADRGPSGLAERERAGAPDHGDRSPDGGGGRRHRGERAAAAH